MGLSLRTLLPLFVLAACQQEPEYGGALPGGDDGGDSAGGDAGGDDDAGDDGGLAVPSPSLDLDGVKAELDAAFALGLPEPFTPRDVFVGFFDEHADPGVCPASELPYYLPGSYESCTATDGTVFYGHGEYQEDIDPEALASFYLLGDFWILDQEGVRFDGAGEALYLLGPDVESSNSTVRVELVYTGSWGYGGSPGWMGELASLAFFGFGSWTDGTWLGGLGGSMDLQGTALYFDDLVFDSRRCTDAPMTGGLRLRDATGYWYTLVFEGACEPCATVVWADDTVLGEVCVDFGTAPGDFLEALLTAGGTVDPNVLP